MRSLEADAVALWKPSQCTLLLIFCIAAKKQHAHTAWKRSQLNREKGSREELPCGVKGQRPLGLPPYNVISSFDARPKKLHSLIWASTASYSRS